MLSLPWLPYFLYKACWHSPLKQHITFHSTQKKTNSMVWVCERTIPLNDNHFIYTILLLVIKNTLLNIVRSYANMILTVMDTAFRVFNNDGSEITKRKKIHWIGNREYFLYAFFIYTANLVTWIQLNYVGQNVAQIGKTWNRKPYMEENNFRKYTVGCELHHSCVQKQFSMLSSRFCACYHSWQ
jgi:hypothetical protein